MHLTLGPDGISPGQADPDCPICVMLAAQGIPNYTLDDDGELVALEARPEPPMIEISVRTDDTTSAYVDAAAFTERVPDGCTARDFAEYVCFTRPALRRAVGPGSLRLRDARGRVLPYGHELSDGDGVVLSRRSATPGAG